jgi:hypothetical protein
VALSPSVMVPKSCASDLNFMTAELFGWAAGAAFCANALKAMVEKKSKKASFFMV